MAEKKSLPEDDDGSPFLTPRRAAAFLRCSPSTILKWRQKGVLPAKRAWTREELLAAARKNSERPPAASGRGKGLKLELPKAPAKRTSETGSDGAPPAKDVRARGLLDELGACFDFDDGAA